MRDSRALLTIPTCHRATHSLSRKLATFAQIAPRRADAQIAEPNPVDGPTDPARFGSMGGRFKSPVVPGETLEVHAWEENGQVMFQTRVGDRVVFDNGVMTRS